MNEGEPTRRIDNNPPPSNEPWQEVGQQLRTLGESLGTALRAAWQDEENRRRVQDLKTGLESMVTQVGAAIRESAESPQAQQARESVGRAAGTVREAGEQAAQEVRPHLLSALEQLNEELRKLVNRIEESRPSGGNPGPNPPPGEGPRDPSGY